MVVGVCYPINLFISILYINVNNFSLYVNIYVIYYGGWIYLSFKKII